MKDVMLDLETLGLTPGSVVLSIGAVAFDRETGKLGESFYKVLRADQQEKAGLTTDPGTLEWWKEQKPEAWINATKNAGDVQTILKDFRLWYKFQGAQAIWANGSNFDVPLLEMVYRKFDSKIPWHYRHPRDVRTVFDLAGKKLGDYGFQNELAHDALQDAIWQAMETMSAIMELRK